MGDSDRTLSEPSYVVKVLNQLKTLQNEVQVKAEIDAFFILICRTGNKNG